MSNILQMLPDFKGKNRLFRMLYGARIRSAVDVVTEGRYSCKYLLPNLQENVGQDIFVNGIYEEHTVSLLRSIIPANGYFMDLGANIGAILIPLMTLRKDIHVVAVEAAPWIYQYLQHNVALNKLDNKHIQIVNNALFDKDNVEMDFYSPTDKYGKGSLSPVFQKDGVKVITRKIETIVRELGWPRVDAIKIDVEGFEYFAFKGAQELLSRVDAPNIVFEFVDWAEGNAMGLQPGTAQKLLLEMGYRLFVLEKDKPRKLDAVLRTGAANLFASKRY